MNVNYTIIVQTINWSVDTIMMMIYLENLNGLKFKI